MISTSLMIKNASVLHKAVITFWVFLLNIHAAKKQVPASINSNCITEICHPFQTAKGSLLICLMKSFIAFILNSVTKPSNEAAAGHMEKQNKSNSSNNIIPDKGTATRLLNKNITGNW